MFQFGQLYARSSDIHDQFGGSRHSGDRYGYADGWSEGVFLYSGEGQRGDMHFNRGNRAVRDHVQDGRDLHLFTALGKGRPCRYEGEFACSGWHVGEASDIDGRPRKTIVFHLVSLGDLLTATQVSGEGALSSDDASLEQIRARAFAAATASASECPSVGRRNIYERSIAVRDYVLARAKGRCECCGADAPFVRHDGSHYLEPHHLRRLSDGGPDHPRWVAAVCPNCHRRIHHGADGKALNAILEAKIGSVESR